MSNVTKFSFQGAEVRTVVLPSGEPGFVGKDVAERLGYEDPTTAIRSHCRGVQILHPIPDALGLDAARARGRAGGRKPKLDAKQIRHIKALLRDPSTCVAELARDYGVSRTTIYKHCGVVQPRHD